MPNPRPTLYGYADPAKPGWEERVLERVEKSLQSKGHVAQKRRKWSLQIFADTEYGLLLREAAKRRGMTMASYVRRAVAARVARDLGLPMREVTRWCAAVTPWDGEARPGQPRVKTSDDGTGWGEW